MLDKHAEQSSNTRARRASGLVHNCIAWPSGPHPSFVDPYEIFTTHSHVSDKGFDVIASNANMQSMHSGVSSQNRYPSPLIFNSVLDYSDTYLAPCRRLDRKGS